MGTKIAPTHTILGDGLPGKKNYIQNASKCLEKKTKIT